VLNLVGPLEYTGLREGRGELDGGGGAVLVAVLPCPGKIDGGGCKQMAVAEEVALRGAVGLRVARGWLCAGLHGCNIGVANSF
jgi:hypothetical protein